MEAAGELGNLKVVNLVLLGAIAPHLPIEDENWTKAIEECVPHKALEVNLKAFARGREL
jgi:indolepyruvate ferredoxin oxidoreductase, beta subunit